MWQWGDQGCCPHTGGFGGADIHTFFVCEVGVLQGMGDRDGGAAVEGGIIEGLSGFCFWLEGDCLFRGGGDFRVVVCARGNSWVLISMGSLSMRLRSFGAREDALVGRPVGGGSLWGFRVSSFGWEVAAAFFVAVGGSRLASVPRRFNCSQIAMRCLSVSLGSFRARETAMGKRPTREASLRGFWIFVFGWRVAVFSRQW